MQNWRFCNLYLHIFFEIMFFYITYELIAIAEFSILKSKFNVQHITLLTIFKLIFPSIELVCHGHSISIQQFSVARISYEIFEMHGIQLSLVFWMQICVPQTSSFHHQQSNQNACFCSIIKWNGIRPTKVHLFFNIWKNSETHSIQCASEILSVRTRQYV